MLESDLVICSEKAEFQADIERLNAAIFGPARFTRAAYMIRKRAQHCLDLSLIAVASGNLIGSVRMTPIVIGTTPSYLLGPIVIDPKFQKNGLGSRLMNAAIEKAASADTQYILLVGDAPYYGRFGFKQVAASKVRMPLPVNPDRLLALDLQHQGLDNVEGDVRPR